MENTTETTETTDLETHKVAQGIVADFGDVAQSDADGLAAAWNVGVSVRYWVDNRMGKLTDLAALVERFDTNGYAVRRGATSAPTLSKYGKLVAVWGEYEAMVDDIEQTDGVTLSWDAAYKYAVRKSGSARKSEPAVSAPETTEPEPETEPTEVIGANVWDADARQLLALVCQRYTTIEARKGVVATLKALVDAGVTA